MCQNVGREYVNGEDAGNSGFNLHPSFAITDAGIVDYGIKAAELVDPIGNGPRPDDCGQVSRDGSLGSGCCREGVATSALVPPVQDNLVTFLDQKLGRHQAEAIR